MYTATVQTHRLGILLASTILTVPHLVARTTESSAAAPAPRYAHQMMTYDDHGGRVLLFGGAGQDATFGDFWSLDAHGWTRLSESGGPPARNSGVLVFDSRRKRAVLFGGPGRRSAAARYVGMGWRAVDVRRDRRAGPRDSHGRGVRSAARCRRALRAAAGSGQAGAAVADGDMALGRPYVDEGSRHIPRGLPRKRHDR